MDNMTPTVKQLLIINVIVFIGCALMGPIDPPLNNPAYKLLSLYYFENPDFRIWQPLTHMFMHGGVMHIAFNMFALVSFGSILERFWGSKKFLFFYISCGLGAFLLHTAANYYFFHEGLEALVSNGFSKTEIMDLLDKGQYNTNWLTVLSSNELQNFMGYSGTAVGASGAIYGLLAAFAFMFPNAELAMLFIPIPIKAKYFVPILVAFDLFSGTTGYDVMGGGIAHLAHVGGAVTGVVMMWVWRKNQFHHKRWN